MGRGVVVMGGGGGAGTYRESRRSERYDRGRHMT